MSALVYWGLMTGSLGLQAIAVGTGLRRQQNRDCLLWQEEEEQLTPYDSKETIDPMEDTAVQRNKKGTNDPRLIGWEFKIVRAPSDLFREFSALKRLCEEEASAGWIMLEKLDDRRIRFKRPIAMREVIRAELLPIDPYRTTYGKPSKWKQWAIAGGLLLLLTLPAYLGFVLISLISRPAPPVSQPQLNLPNPNP
jgi:hypothetical protein